jgi:hypothetical protein
VSNCEQDSPFNKTQLSEFCREGPVQMIMTTHNVLFMDKSPFQSRFINKLHEHIIVQEVQILYPSHLKGLAIIIKKYKLITYNASSFQSIAHSSCLTCVTIHLCSAATCLAPCQYRLATDRRSLVSTGGLALSRDQSQGPAKC